jgi:site-specific recombinase XerD
LIYIKSEGGADDPIFSSRKGKGHLHPSHVKRIVTAATERAGVDGQASPHWLRHAHATHALDSDVPIHLVQATLGHVSVATIGKYLHARPEDSSARYLGF